MSEPTDLLQVFKEQLTRFEARDGLVSVPREIASLAYGRRIPRAKRHDLEYLFRRHNRDLEGEPVVDWHLTHTLFEQPMVRSALEQVAEGIVVELGSYGGITLEQLAEEYMARASVLVLGVDAGDYSHYPYQTKFSRMTWQHVTELTESTPADSATHHFVRGVTAMAQDYNISVYQGPHNAFAVYDAPAEALLSALSPFPIRLAILKCMLPYLPLAHIEAEVLPHVDSVLIADYRERHIFTEAHVPSPRAVASVFRGWDVQIETGQSYFMLYAKRQDAMQLQPA